MERALEAARASGLVPVGEPLLVLLSGGADSVCLLDVSVRLEARVSALHVNYGLRVGADADEAFCRDVSERLGVPLAVEPVALAAAEPGASGNLQAEAREARYEAAERAVAERGGAYAAAHTATDQAETVLYRLAVSPGRRALMGMEPRRGRLVRPLLEVTRAETRAYCRARGLGWREDPSNEDPRFARARVRHEVLPVLRDLNPAAERTIAETALLLGDEHEVLEGAVGEALERLGGPAVSLAALRELPRGLARLVLRRLGEEAAGGPLPLSRADAYAVLALGARGGTQSLDVGGGVTAVVEYGTLRFRRGAEGEGPPPEPVRLAVPGRVRFGPWEVAARPVARRGAASPADDVVSADALGSAVTVRAWRAGDRVHPAGLGGSKSLQDLFVDRKVPRALRRSLPVVEVNGEIAWVAGLTVGERFRPRTPAAAEAGNGEDAVERLVALSARRVA